MSRGYFCVTPRKSRTGGADHALDNTAFHSEKSPETGDVALVFEEDQTFEYHYDATSLAAEDGWNIVRPDPINAISTGRWILQSSYPNILDRLIDGGNFDSPYSPSTKWDLLQWFHEIDSATFTGSYEDIIIDGGTY